MFEPGTYRIAADLLRIWGADGKVIATRAWGDRLTVTGGDANGVDVFIGQPGRVKKPAQTALVPIDVARAPKILRIDFVDVQQGDAAVLETPGGTTLVVDGGQNVQFSRYMAARYPRTTVDRPQRIDCMVVTHGDADHFAGLTEIHKTESAASKRVFIAPDRIFHNGLVKRTESPELGPARRRRAHRAARRSAPAPRQRHERGLPQVARRREGVVGAQPELPDAPAAAGRRRAVRVPGSGGGDRAGARADDRARRGRRRAAVAGERRRVHQRALGRAARPVRQRALPARRRPEHGRGEGVRDRPRRGRDQPAGGSAQGAAPRLRRLPAGVPPARRAGRVGRLLRRRGRERSHPPARDAGRARSAATPARSCRGR